MVVLGEEWKRWQPLPSRQISSCRNFTSTYSLREGGGHGGVGQRRENCGRSKHYFSQRIPKMSEIMMWVGEFFIVILPEYNSLYRSINSFHGRLLAQSRASQWVWQEWTIGLQEVITPSALELARGRVLSAQAMSSLPGHRQPPPWALSFSMCARTWKGLGTTGLRNEYTCNHGKA